MVERRSRWPALIVPLFSSGASGSNSAPATNGTIPDAEMQQNAAKYQRMAVGAEGAQSDAEGGIGDIEGDDLLEAWAEEDFETLYPQKDNLIPVPKFTDEDYRNHEKIVKEHGETVARMEHEHKQLKEWIEMTEAAEHARRVNISRSRVRRLQEDIVTIKLKKNLANKNFGY